MSDDSYLRSLSSLSCGLLDGLCQAEDEEDFSAEEQLPEPDEEAPESEEEEDFAPRVVKPVSTPTPKKRVAVSRDAIETFKEHLRKGLAVTKHCSNGKTKPRVLFCDDACSKLGWQKPNGTPAKNTDLLPLRSVVEIRAGVEIDKQGSREDPKGRTLMGTPTLRKCIDGTSARRVFSFIFRDRTLDLEFSTEEECRRNLRLAQSSTVQHVHVGGVSRRYKHLLHMLRGIRGSAGADKAAILFAARAFRAGWGAKNPSSSGVARAA